MCADHATEGYQQDNDQEEESDGQVAQNEPVPVDDAHPELATCAGQTDDTFRVDNPAFDQQEDEQVAQNEPVPVDDAYPELAACTGQIDDTFCVDNPAFEDMTPGDAYDQDMDDILQDEVYDSGEEEEGDTDMVGLSCSLAKGVTMLFVSAAVNVGQAFVLSVLKITSTRGKDVSQCNWRFLLLLLFFFCQKFFSLFCHVKQGMRATIYMQKAYRGHSVAHACTHVSDIVAVILTYTAQALFKTNLDMHSMFTNRTCVCKCLALRHN